MAEGVSRTFPRIAYLLPSKTEHEQALQELADECLREGGSAWLMAVHPRSADEVFRDARARLS